MSLTPAGVYTEVEPNPISSPLFRRENPIPPFAAPRTRDHQELHSLLAVAALDAAAMKFPLASDAFPPVALSREEVEALVTLAERQLAQTMTEFDRHLLEGGGVVDQQRWKPLKTRAHVTVFRERADAAIQRHTSAQRRRDQLQSSQSANPESESSREFGYRPAMLEGDDWPLPRLLGVGTLKGSLDDCMYGVHSPTAAHMMAKAVYSDDEVVDAQVLHEIAGPTVAHPFRFLGLKWLVKTHPAAMGAVVLPRDIVYVEHTGILTRDDGSRLGHFLIHSVELPQCPELRHEQGLVRARVSSCCLMRPRADNPQQVDVFMTGRVMPQGRVLDSLALLSAANGLTYFWKAIESSQRRKLAWRLQHKLKAASTSAIKISNSATQCPVCHKALGRPFTSSASCEMCGRSTCSRCRVVRKLVLPGPYGSKQTHQVSVDLCKPCIKSTIQEEAVAIARQEIRAGQYGMLTSPRWTRSQDISARPLRRPKSTGCVQTTEHSKLTSFGRSASAGFERVEAAETVTRRSLQALDDLLDTTDRAVAFDEARDVLTESEDDQSLLGVLQSSDKDIFTDELEDKVDEDDEEDDGEGFDELWIQSERTRQTVDAIQGLPLWQKLSALQLMADTTYHLSKKNTRQIIA